MRNVQTAEVRVPQREKVIDRMSNASSSDGLVALRMLLALLAPIRFLWHIQQSPDKSALCLMPSPEEWARQLFVAILSHHGSR